MVNKDKIVSDLHKHFQHTGQVTVDEEGLVNCTGHIKLMVKTPQLPVQFGHVSGRFNIMEKDLTTLAGCPQHVGSVFLCAGNQITTLEGAPQSVGSIVDLSKNHLNNLVGMPQTPMLDILDNPLNSLKGLPGPDILKSIVISWNPRLPLLQLLSYDVVNMHHEPDQVEKIMEKYRGKGKKAALSCAAELVKAGYKDNARW